MLKKYGHERGTMHVLMRLAEEQNDMQGTIKDIVETLDKISSVVVLLNGVADGMKDRIESMGKHFQDDARSTHAIVTSEGSDD
jgi:argininosuccinate lyase